MVNFEIITSILALGASITAALIAFRGQREIKKL